VPGAQNAVLDALTGCDDRAVMRFLAVLLSLLVLAACGTDKPVTSEQPARRERPAEAVIRAWADALRSGDVVRAAEFFALPSVVSNGTPPITLRTTLETRAFNRSLPCGAVLQRTYRKGRYTAAVFRLTERPGAGRCGTGTGASARTAFLVRGGKIVQWRRLAEAQAPPAPVV
jgi:hypothetical protein